VPGRIPYLESLGVQVHVPFLNLRSKGADMRPTIVAATLLALFAFAVPCSATTRLMKLSEDRYLITHQKQTNFGGQGKALRQSYAKAGSLCVILGYSWFEILESESKGRTWGSGAASTLEVKLYKEKPAGGDDLLDCASLADEEQKEKMRKALEKLRS
jgi:hypothetical protein